MQSYPFSDNAMAADGDGTYYQQPSSSQQQQPAGYSNPDELQLTAQLSRGLAPIMNAGPVGGIPEEQAQTDMAQQYSHHEQFQAPGGIPEGQDQRGVVQQYGHHEQAQAHGAHLQPNPAQLEEMRAQQAASPDASNRKRSKVSRACDECRRKKIRCDATEESGDQQCSSCKRVGARCQFSRVPMKRGPSKGYVIDRRFFSSRSCTFTSTYFLNT